MSKGDFIFVPSRTIHAILKGNMVLEIQQTSDVTYRVYDWDRVDEKGKSRELHIEKAAEVMTYSKDKKAPILCPKKLLSNEIVEHVILLKCSYFNIEKVDLNSGSLPLTLGKKNNPDILVIIEGEGQLSFRTNTGSKKDVLYQTSIKAGETILIPCNMIQYSVHAEHITLLRIYY